MSVPDSQSPERCGVVNPFHDQFVITSESWDAPPDFCQMTVGRWTIWTHPSSPVHVLNTSRNEPVGVIIGMPIVGHQLHFAPTEFRLPDASGPIEAVEKFLDETSGRYVLALLTHESLSPRVYPDAFATLSLVYSPSAQRIASTTSLLNYRPGTTPAYPINVYPDTGFYYYPAGLTDDPNCSRLLPNHQLDLNSWTTERFWPREAIEPCAGGQQGPLVERAVNVIRDNLIASAPAGHPTYGSLTSGRDSRVLLACTPQAVRQRTNYITFEYEGRPAYCDFEVDSHIGGVLARKCGLQFQRIPAGEVSPEIRSSYFYRIGRAGGTGKARDFFQAAYQNLNMDGVWLTGFGGEVNCMYFVRDEDRRTRPSAAELLRRTHIPTEHGILEAVESWLSRIPSDWAGELIVELFYLENRVGVWACPHLYGAAPFFANLIPYSDRRYVKACYEMPYQFRRTRASQMAMIELADPSLLSIPFQRLTGLTLWQRRLLQNRFVDFTRWFPARKSR